MSKKTRKQAKETSAASSTTSRHLLFLGVFVVAAVPAAYLALPGVFTVDYQAPGIAEGEVIPKETEEQPPVLHLETPEPLYAIYMTQCVVGTPSFRESLVKLIEETQLNSVVIDVKDYSGTIGFPTKDPRFEAASMQSCGAYDMKEFLEELHGKGIYTIARITVFQDPLYAELHPEEAVQSRSRPGEPWKDHKGLAFVDVSSRAFWEYIAVLSKETYELGFDELNYDYIRYPSDGNMSDASYINPNRAVAVEAFWKYLDENRPEGSIISADLFGYTTVLYDDLGIGQQLERALPYFDYIAPMVYPSHYNKGFAGLANPNSDPYKVVFESMKEAVRRAAATSTTVAWSGGAPIASTSPPACAAEPCAAGRQLYTKPAHDILKLRPWLQDFDYGGNYGAEEVREQMQATYDAGLTSWMLWDPANQYTRGALDPAAGQ